MGQSTCGLRKFEDYQFVKLYRKGLSDAKIAKILGTSQVTVSYRRRKLGLKAHYKSWIEVAKDYKKRLNMFYGTIEKGPKFSDEIEAYDALNLCRRLKSKNFPIRTFKHQGPIAQFRIFYLEGQEEKAIGRIFLRFPQFKHSWIGSQIRRFLEG
jgi:hypothetical protein